MNERIRELWAKCVIKHAKDPMNWQTVADEFAELIVQECIDIVADAVDHREPASTYVDKIKQHFGVQK